MCLYIMRQNVVRIPSVHVDTRCQFTGLWLDILRQLQSSKYQWWSVVPSGRQNYILLQSSALCQRCYCALFSRISRANCNKCGGSSGCHQMIFIWSWEKNLGSLSLAAVSGQHQSTTMMIAEQLVPSSHFSQQHTVVHSLEMPNDVKDKLYIRIMSHWNLFP